MFLSTYSLQYASCRHVCPDSFEVFEDCVGLYATDNSKADTLTQLIKDALVRLSLPLERCHGSVMTVPATCLVEYPVLQLKFSRLNQELFIFIAWDTVSPLLSKTLAVPQKSWLTHLTLFLSLEKFLSTLQRKKQCS